MCENSDTTDLEDQKLARLVQNDIVSIFPVCMQLIMIYGKTVFSQI